MSCKGPRKIYRVLWNSSRTLLGLPQKHIGEKVLQAEIYQLKIQTSLTLILYDIFYASGIPGNLLSVLEWTCFGFNFSIYVNCINIYLE